VPSTPVAIGNGIFIPGRRRLIAVEQYGAILPGEFISFILIIGIFQVEFIATTQWAFHDISISFRIGGI
jgi:hypothetical protein